MTGRAVVDPVEDVRTIALNAEQVGCIAASAAALEDLGQIERKVADGGSALQLSWEPDPDATLECAGELRTIVAGWKMAA